MAESKRSRVSVDMARLFAEYLTFLRFRPLLRTYQPKEEKLLRDKLYEKAAKIEIDLCGSTSQSPPCLSRGWWRQYGYELPQGELEIVD